MPTLLPWFVSGMGLGWIHDKNKKSETIYYGAPEFGDYLDRTSWFNPISSTNVDQYIIGGSILVLLYKLVK